MALSMTGWASSPGMRNVPKPRRGIAMPCVMIDSMMSSFRSCGGGRARATATASRGWLVRKSMRQIVIVSGGCPARRDEVGDNAIERRCPFDRRPALVAELDPALVEAVKHPDPRQRILRTLGTE